MSSKLFNDIRETCCTMQAGSLLLWDLVPRGMGRQQGREGH